MLSSFITTKDIHDNIDYSYEKKSFDYFYTGIMNSLNDVDVLSEYVCFQDSIDYVTRYVNLLDKNEVDEILYKVNQQSNMLNISPGVIEKYFVLGKNDLQGSYFKEVGSQDIKNTGLPSFEKLLKCGIMDEFISSPFLYIKNDTLEEDIIKNQDSIKKSWYNEVFNFYSNIKDKIIYYSLDKGDFFLVMVINSGFLDKYRQELNKQNKNLMIFDKKNQPVWSSSAESVKLIQHNSDKITLNSNSKEIVELDKSKYLVMQKELGQYGLKLLYTVPKGSFLNEYGGKILRCITVMLIFMFAIFCLSYGFSYYIIKPVESLTGVMKHSLSYREFKDIPQDSFNKLFLSKWTFKKKIILYFVITGFIPLLLCGLFYVRWVYLLTTERIEQRVTIASSQMKSNLIYQTEHYNSLLNLLSASEVYTTAASRFLGISEEEKKQIDLQLSKKISSIGDISYFVLLNTSGMAKYQSIYTNNSLSSKDSNGNILKFSVDMNIINNTFKKSDNDIFWVIGLKDIFNKNIVSVVKKIKSDEGNNSKTTGYLQMVLRDNAFQHVMQNHQMSFVVLDKSASLIYTSHRDNGFDNIAQKQALKGGGREKDIFFKNIDGINHLIVREYIPQKGWSMFVFQRMDDALAKSMELLKQNLILIIVISSVAFLILCQLAEFLVKPIDALKNDMRKVIANGEFSVPFDYAMYDEIGELVHVYNMMIKHIKLLVEDNINSKVREQELMTLKMQAELNMLQQQINPHFLYNTLEVINMQVRCMGKSDVSKMLEALAQIFRFCTRTDNKVVLLKQEINHVRNYIMIQQMRFKDKFEVEWNLQEKSLEIGVLKLILQPIVENAINHGLYEYTSGGIIAISTRIKDNFLYIIVSDNGIGMRETELNRLIDSLVSSTHEADERDCNVSKCGNGIALRNVYRRLQIHYNGRASMDIHSKYMTGTEVKIKIPLDA